MVKANYVNSRKGQPCPTDRKQLVAELKESCGTPVSMKNLVEASGVPKNAWDKVARSNPGNVLKFRKAWREGIEAFIKQVYGDDVECPLLEQMFT